MGINKKAIETILIIAIVIFTVIAVYLIVFLPKPDKDILEQSIIDFEVDVTVRNTGNETALNVPLRLGLPLDHPPSQYVDNIDLSEKPDKRTVDSQENKFIHYNIKRLEPQSEEKFILNISLRLVSVDFNIENAKIGKVQYDENLTRYLIDGPYIEVSDPEIQKEALEIAGKSSDPVDIARNTYEWVVDNIVYKHIPGEVGAAKTIRSREGDSGELGNLFVALMRANGIPARRLSGWGHHFAAGEELPQEIVSHGFAEFYFPDFGWIQADPTFGQKHKFENFAKTDPAHVIMTFGTSHFIERGAPEAPTGYGRNEIFTDYVIKVKNIRTQNLSTKRNLIVAWILIMPAIFAIFLIYKNLTQRRI